MKKTLLIIFLLPILAYSQNFSTTLTKNDDVSKIVDSLNVISMKLNHLYNLDTTQQDTSLIINDIIRSKLDSVNLNLTSVIDSLSKLTNILNVLTPDCIGSNETYYIDGTNTISLNSSEVCSYTITVIEEKVSFTENGISSPFDLPVGYSGSSSFRDGSKYLINQISFTGTSAGSRAVIKVIK